MPKKIKQEEEMDEEDDFDAEEEDEDEEEEPQPQPRRVGRPAVKRRAPEPPAKRYASFRQEAAEGIIDVETNEVVAGDLWSALADMKSQLDRIENAIGVL